MRLHRSAISRKACGHSHGFTLLELLLALALSLIVAAALAASLFTAFKARASAMDTVDAARQISLVGDIIEREVADALPPTPLPTNTATVTLPGQSSASSGILVGPFEGTADTIDFFCSGPERKATLQGDVREISYLLDKDPNGGNGRVLIRRVTTNLLASQLTPDPDEIICHDVTALEFSYYDGTAWNDTWDSSVAQLNAPINTIPVAVQITIEMATLRTGGPIRRTVRVVPLSCSQPLNQQTPTVTAPSTVTGL